MKKALIFGITGQDASYLAKFLLGKGYKVFGTSRSKINETNFFKFYNLINQVTFHSVNLNDFKSLKELILQIMPDEIYNLGAQSSVSFSFKNPIETKKSIELATLNIIEIILSINKEIKYFNACSSECFGDTGNLIADENSQFKPISPYAEAKAITFEKVSNLRNKNNLFLCSAIMFNHESPFRPEKFVTRKITLTAVKIKLGITNKLNLGNLLIERDWGWAPDYVEAMWLMLQQNSPDDYILATGQSNSLSTFVKTAFNMLDLNWKNYVEFDNEMNRKFEILKSSGNPNKAKTKLGWVSTMKMEDVISNMIEHDYKLMSGN